MECYFNVVAYVLKDMVRQFNIVNGLIPFYRLGPVHAWECIFMKNDNKKSLRSDSELYNYETWRGAWRGGKLLMACELE